MKYFLLFCLSMTFGNMCHTMQRGQLSQYENLEREIFLTKVYRDYSFKYLQEITPGNPLHQKVFASLIMRGRQKYATLKSCKCNLEDFKEYSLSDLESIKVN